MAQSDEPLWQPEPAARLALVWARTCDRPIFATLFAFEATIARIVTQAREPLLAQIKLAWWREEVSGPSDGFAGEPLLTAIHTHWPDDHQVFEAILDAWDHALELGPDHGRDRVPPALGDAFAAVAVRFGLDEAREACSEAGRLWGRMHTANGLSDQAFLAAARLGLPRRLRPFAILGGLSRRALIQNRPALLGDRLSPLAALRLGIMGF